MANIYGAILKEGNRALMKVNAVYYRMGVDDRVLQNIERGVVSLCHVLWNNGLAHSPRLRRPCIYHGQLFFSE